MGILNADGAFADYVSVPTANLHIVPENISDEEAVFAEPLAAAFEILSQIQLNPGDEVLVLGDGKLGNLCAQALRLSGAKVTVLGKHADKLALIKKAGVRIIELKDWQPRQFDVAVEATGAASGLELALGAVRPRGILILKSTIAGKHQVSLAPIVINEINVIGSRCGPFPDALAALAAKQVSVMPLIEKCYALSDAVAAVNHAAKAGAGSSVALELHRIDEDFAIKDITGHGFVYEGHYDKLRNPADDRSKIVFDKSIRGKTDRFVHLYRKPKA